jgi:adenylate kinase
MLGVLTPEQKQAKANVENYFKTTAKKTEAKLEAFVEPAELKFETLLRYFMDAERIKRAQQIKDEDVTIQQETANEIRAMVKEYHVVIDLENKVILHDCADWSKMLPSKKLCKHLGKLLLTLNKEKATMLLRQVYSNQKSWNFKPYAQ